MIHKINHYDIQERINTLIEYEDNNEQIEKLKNLDESDTDEIAFMVNEKMEYGYDLDTVIDDNIDLYLEKQQDKQFERAKGYLETTVNKRLTDKQVNNIISFFGKD